MLRRLLIGVLTFATAALLVITAISYRTKTLVGLAVTDQDAVVTLTSVGSLALVHFHYRSPDARKIGGGNLTKVSDHDLKRAWARLIHFKIVHHVMPGGTGYLQSLVVPLWVPILLFAFYPSLCFIRGPMRRWRRRRSGRCVSCGYDLRGCVDRCPECGTEFA